MKKKELKQQLKRANAKYEDAEKALGISNNTIKMQMNKIEKLNSKLAIVKKMSDNIANTLGVEKC